MGPAHTSDLAWRVVLRFHWYDQSVADICCPRTGLAVSRHFVADVLARFEATGDVATRQGQGANHSSRRVLSADDDLAIIKLLIETPQATLRDHRAEFILESGKVVSYSSFCGAVHRLGFTRKKVRSPAWSAAFLLLATSLSLATFRVQTFASAHGSRSDQLDSDLPIRSCPQVRALAYQCDRDKAIAWLAETLTFFAVEELGVLDETSKDFDTLKGRFGYSIRGTECSTHDQAISHIASRTSCLVLHTVQDGFLDWAMTPGTFNREYFLHVTTENFVDWRGTWRRPMLVCRAPRFARMSIACLSVACPAASHTGTTLTANSLPPLRFAAGPHPTHDT